MEDERERRGGEAKLCEQYSSGAGPLARVCHGDEREQSVVDGEEPQGNPKPMPPARGDGVKGHGADGHVSGNRDQPDGGEPECHEQS